jgi:acetyl-CoA acyltransferase
MARDGISPQTYAKIAVKARKHAANNPNAVFRDALTVEQVLASPMIFDPITKLQCCPPTSGAAAVILCSEAFARRKGLNNSVSVAGMAMVAEDRSTFGGSAIDVVGTVISRKAALAAYDEAGVGAADVDVIELHDCFTINEALSYESLGLVDEGGAIGFIEDELNSYGGRFVVNPSGGLLAKGHPLGATGLAQIAELTWQLRGEAEARQVEGARVGLQHNVGLNGAAIVSVLVNN